MEITIKIDGAEQGVQQPAAGAAQPAAGSHQEPSPELAARAATLGAINAGPAHVPAGADTGPVSFVTAASDVQAQALDSMAAGPAPLPTAEPEPIVLEADAGDEQ